MNIYLILIIIISFYTCKNDTKSILEQKIEISYKSINERPSQLRPYMSDYNENYIFYYSLESGNIYKLNFQNKQFELFLDCNIPNETYSKLFLVKLFNPDSALYYRQYNIDKESVFYSYNFKTKKFATINIEMVENKYIPIKVLHSQFENDTIFYAPLNIRNFNKETYLNDMHNKPQIGKFILYKNKFYGESMPIKEKNRFYEDKVNIVPFGFNCYNKDNQSIVFIVKNIDSVYEFNTKTNVENRYYIKSDYNFKTEKYGFNANIDSVLNTSTISSSIFYNSFCKKYYRLIKTNDKKSEFKRFILIQILDKNFKLIKTIRLKNDEEIIFWLKDKLFFQSDINRRTKTITYEIYNS